jgi:hypothetical protein
LHSTIFPAALVMRNRRWTSHKTQSRQTRPIDYGYAPLTADEHSGVGKMFRSPPFHQWFMLVSYTLRRGVEWLDSSSGKSLRKGFGMLKHWIFGATIAAGLAGLVTTPAYAVDKKEKDANELTIHQVPAPVKATINKEAGKDGKVGDIEKKTEDGKTVYEAELTLGDKKYELKVAEDGKLISKELDQDKDEKDEKGEHQK